MQLFKTQHIQNGLLLGAQQVLILQPMSCALSQYTLHTVHIIIQIFVITFIPLISAPSSPLTSQYVQEATQIKSKQLSFPSLSTARQFTQKRTRRFRESEHNRLERQRLFRHYKIIVNIIRWTVLSSSLNRIMVLEHSVYTGDQFVSELHHYQTVTVKSKHLQDAPLHAARCTVWCILCAGGCVEPVLLQDSVNHGS